MSPESVACAFDPNDDGVVQQPVEEGGRDAGSSEEDVAPFGEASVRGEDHRALFATRIDDLEDETCAAQGDGEATNFVDDEQRGPREEAYLFDELSLSFVFGEAVGEFGECRSLDALSAFDGGEGGRKVAFSGSGRYAVPVPGLRVPAAGREADDGLRRAVRLLADHALDLASGHRNSCALDPIPTGAKDQAHQFRLATQGHARQEFAFSTHQPFALNIACRRMAFMRD